MTSHVNQNLKKTKQTDHHRWIGLAVVLTGVFMAILDILIVYVGIPSIQSELQATSAEVELVVAGYGLTYAVLLVTGGRLGDLYGRKRIFMIGMAGFVLLSTICGLATSRGFLIAGRLVQGATAAVMYPQTTAIIQATFTGEDRDWAFALVGIAIGLAMVGGFLIGGLLIQWNLFNLGWRLIFFFNVPVGLAAIGVGSFFLTETKAEEQPSLDLPGVAILTIGLTALIYPLAMGPQAGWPMWAFICLTASVPILAAFFWWETHLARKNNAPLMEPSLFSDRAFSAGLLLVLAFFLIPPAFFLVVMIYFQNGLGFSALQAGLTVAPDGVGFLIGSFAAARLRSTLGRHVLSIGTGVMALGMAGIAFTAYLVKSSIIGWAFVPAMLVIGLGHGLVMSPLFGIILSNVSSKQAGAASGVLFTTQQVTEAISVVLVGIIFFGTLAAAGNTVADEATEQFRAKIIQHGTSISQAKLQTVQFHSKAEKMLNKMSKGGHAKEKKSSNSSSTFTKIPSQNQSIAQEIFKTYKSRLYKQAFIRSLLWCTGVLLFSIGFVFLLPNMRT